MVSLKESSLEITMDAIAVGNFGFPFFLERLNCDILERFQRWSYWTEKFNGLRIVRRITDDRLSASYFFLNKSTSTVNQRSSSCQSQISSDWIIRIGDNNTLRILKFRNKFSEEGKVNWQKASSSPATTLSSIAESLQNGKVKKRACFLISFARLRCVLESGRFK